VQRTVSKFERLDHTLGEFATDDGPRALGQSGVRLGNLGQERCVMAREWPIQVAGTRHRVVLGEGPRTFSVDGVEHSLGRFYNRGVRTAEFDLDGHGASITLRLVTPSMGARSKRSFMKGGLRLLPDVILAFIFGGGVDAASALESTVLQWAIYELRVDGESLGCWVSTVSGDSSSTWMFVGPGGALPERDWLDWPAPRTRGT
jgi:hypothetical protein